MRHVDAKRPKSRVARAKAFVPTEPSAALMVYRVRASSYLDKVAVVLASRMAPGDKARRISSIPVVAAAKRAGRLAQDHARAELARAFGKPIPKSVRGDAAVLEAFVAEQTRLFQKLGDDIREKILTGADQANILNMASARARLISSDQVFKMQGESVAYYAQLNGSTKAVWKTRADERVRPKHAAMNNKSFFWNDPPPVGRDGSKHLPGGDILCRCSAIPVIPVQVG